MVIYPADPSFAFKYAEKNFFLILINILNFWLLIRTRR